MGHVGDEDDEDLDSDEAFGSSDEERFEGFTFRGSSGLKQKKKSRRKVELAEDGEAGLDLDEGEDVDSEEEDDESLGEDAVDLATALDQYEESEDEEPQASKRKRRLDNEGDHGSDFGGFSDETGEDDETSDFSVSDADDDADANQLSKLQDLISSLDAESAPAPFAALTYVVHSCH